MSALSASRRRGVAIASIAGVLAVIVVAWLMVSGSMGSAPRAADSVSPAPSVTPTTTPAPVEAPAITDGSTLAPESATAVLASYFSSIDGLSPETELDSLGAVARGVAFSEIEAQQMEYAANGWTLSGQPRIEGLTILSSNVTAAVPTVSTQACVDSSDVKVLRADGEPAFGVDPQTVRALNIFRFDFVDGSWVLAGHSFPDATDC